MRRRRLRKRHHLVDQHAIASLRRRLEPELDIARQYLAERAVDRELLEIELLRIERHRAAAVRAGCHQAAEARQASEGLGEKLRVADVLEHDVHALAVGDALHLRGQILLAIVDAVIRAEIDRGLHSLVSAGGSDDLGPEILRHLDARGAEAASRAHDQDRLAAFELRGIAQEAESGRRVTRDDGGDGEIDALRNRARQRRRHLHVLGVAAPAMHADDRRRRGRRRLLQVLHGDDAIAYLALRHVLPDGFDDAGGIHTEDVRQPDGHRVLARAHHEIQRAVHRNRFYADQHLVRAGHRRRHFLEAQHLGRAELADDDRLHGTACVMNDCGGGPPHCDCKPSSADSRFGAVRAFSTSVSVQCSCTRPHGSFQ